MPPLLVIDALRKEYRRGWPRRRVSFSLAAELVFPDAAIVGIMGPNGAGKTTLFELIAGSNVPSGGRVMIAGQNIHGVRYGERDRLAIHYHQSYQVRRFRRALPSVLLERARSDYPVVHLFDEPQFNTQDGYIGFMLDFFRRLRGDGRHVFLCLHPTAAYHIEIMKEVCERFLFVAGGGIAAASDFAALAAQPAARTYLGALAA